MNHPSTTTPDQLAELKRQRYILAICSVAAIGGFLFGFDSGVINGTVDGLQSAFGSDSVGTGFNVASMLLGCAIGAFFAGRLADRFGRKSLLSLASYSSTRAVRCGADSRLRILGEPGEQLYDSRKVP